MAAIALINDGYTTKVFFLQSVNLLYFVDVPICPVGVFLPGSVQQALSRTGSDSVYAQ